MRTNRIPKLSGNATSAVSPTAAAPGREGLTERYAVSPSALCHHVDFRVLADDPEVVMVKPGYLDIHA